jgi:hypothetical protein
MFSYWLEISTGQDRKHRMPEREKMRVHHVQLSPSRRPFHIGLGRETSFACLRSWSKYSSQRINKTSTSKVTVRKRNVQTSLFLFFVLGFFMLLGDFCVQQVKAEKNLRMESKETLPNAEWYIVLVSIPVMDKVLPLKHLADELLHRGYRVGFALPEVLIIDEFLLKFTFCCFLNFLILKNRIVGNW